MADIKYLGKNNDYFVQDPTPIAYGRVSVLILAKDKQDNEVVIKEFRNEPRSNSDFTREVNAHKSLTHHNILPIIDYGESPAPRNAPFLIMPYCRYGNLANLIGQQDFIPLDLSLTILEQVAQGVDYAHRNGFVHGDIKPSNVLFYTNETHACLSDFGSAKFFPVDVPITVSDPLPATLMYLSPEQIVDNKQLPASDIYALAVVAYEMLTGGTPFKKELPPYQLLVNKATGNIIDPLQFNHQLSLRVCQGLLNGMEKDPKSRPPSATEFVRMLGEVKSPSKEEKAHLFISYRRSDSTDIAGRIYDRLIAKFDRNTVFKDVDSIPLGLDFKEYLDKQVGECNVLLAIIGDRWLDARSGSGERRLDDPADFVRIEIESALARGIPVIPLLVRDAKMPSEEQLPLSLRKLVYRNGIPIRSDPDFHRDMDRLISALEKYGG